MKEGAIVTQGGVQAKFPSTRLGSPWYAHINLAIHNECVAFPTWYWQLSCTSHDPVIGTKWFPRFVLGDKPLYALAFAFSPWIRALDVRATK